MAAKWISRYTKYIDFVDEENLKELEFPPRAHYDGILRP